MHLVEINSDVRLLGDVEFDADWAEGCLLVISAAPVRLILDAEALDRLTDVLLKHRQPHRVARLHAVK